MPAAIFLALGLPLACQGSGMTWRWSNPLPHGNDIVDMAWNGDLSVQVAELGQIYTGNNFFGWFPQNSGTTSDLQAVTFFGNRIVIAGANGTVGYSDDGVNFITSSLNTTNWLVGLAASPNLVVAVGDNAFIFTSSDGAGWTRLTNQPPGVGANWLLSAAWGGGVFVATGEKGYVANSGDGKHWTNHSSGVTSDLMHVAWVSTSNAVTTFPYTGFWAVAYDGKTIYSTNNGVTWRQFTVLNSTNILYAVTANDTSGLIAGDSDVRIGMTVSNQIIWPKQAGSLPNSAPVWTYYAALWDTNGAYRLAGDNGMMVQGTATNNNYNWQMQYPGARDLLWQVALAADLYVAVGDHARIMTSGNGVDWSIEAIPLTNSISSTNSVFLGVGGNTNMFIAAGTRGSLAISPNNPTPVVITNLDGTTFTNQVGTLGVIWYSLPAPTTNDLAGVCSFSNSFFIAGGNGTILRSPDGTNWTKVTIPATNDLSGLDSSISTLVAVGDQGLILTSSDGTNWIKRTSGTTNGLIRARYLNGQFLAVGENGIILKSSDSVSWSPVASGTTNWLNDAVMVTNTCYVVGNNGTLLASTNFVNWTNLGCITRSSLYAAATQNGQLLVVGLQGAILRSQIVPDLTPLDIVSFTQASGENIFLVAGHPDQKFTLDSSTDLVNWSTGPLLDLIYGSGTLVFIIDLSASPPVAQFYRATLAP